MPRLRSPGHRIQGMWLWSRMASGLDPESWPPGKTKSGTRRSRGRRNCGARSSTIMRKLNAIIVVGACALVASCTTTTKQTTYWTEKSGIVTVHHVVGKVDQAEKLTEKRLTKEEIAAYKLPKGTYFRVESEQIDTPTTSAEAEPKAKTKDR